MRTRPPSGRVRSGGGGGFELGCMSPMKARVVGRFGSSGAPLAFSASEPHAEGAKLKGTPTGAGGAVVALMNR